MLKKRSSVLFEKSYFEFFEKRFVLLFNPNKKIDDNAERGLVCQSQSKQIPLNTFCFVEKLIFLSFQKLFFLLFGIFSYFVPFCKMNPINFALSCGCIVMEKYFFFSCYCWTKKIDSAEPRLLSMLTTNHQLTKQKTTEKKKCRSKKKNSLEELFSYLDQQNYPYFFLRFMWRKGNGINFKKKRKMFAAGVFPFCASTMHIGRFESNETCLTFFVSKRMEISIFSNAPVCVWTSLGRRMSNEFKMLSQFFSSEK